MKNEFIALQINFLPIEIWHLELFKRGIIIEYLETLSIRSRYFCSNSYCFFFVCNFFIIIIPPNMLFISAQFIFVKAYVHYDEN